MPKSSKAKEEITDEEPLVNIRDDPKVASLLKSIDQGIEFEVRFGINDGSGHFVSNIGIHAHKKIIKGLSKYITNSDVVERSIVMFNTNSNSNLRMTRTFDQNWKEIATSYMRKSQIGRYDDIDHGIRYNLAQEEQMPDDFEPPETDKTKNSFRYRLRRSIMLDKNWRLDISKTSKLESITKQEILDWKNQLILEENTDKILIDVGNITGGGGGNSSTPIVAPRHYEIELEYIGKVRSFETIIDELQRHMNLINSKIYQSHSEISTQIRMNIFNSMKNILNTRNGLYIHTKPLDNVSIKDVGNQVITLEFKSLSKVQNDEYTVTEKTHGERMLLFGNGKVVKLITSGNDVMNVKIQKNTNLGIFVLDGEYVKLPNDMAMFYVFDMLIAKSQDITQMQFQKRQKIAEDAIAGLEMVKGEKLKIIKKVFIDLTETSFFTKNKIILDANRNYDIDGLIYTPIRGNYYDTIYKWKMVHTIDFLIRKSENDNIYDLYVRATKADMKQNQWEFPKNYGTLFPKIDITANNFPFLFMPESGGLTKNKKWYQTEISKAKIGELQLDVDTIVEFEWNSEKEKWIPLWARPDRTAIYKDPNNKVYFGNAYNTALSIYRAILFPITTEMMMGIKEIPKNYWQAGNKDNIRAMLNFHSYVKIRLYTDYTKNVPAILELGGGRANDFKKWINSGIETVTVLDIDPAAIQEGSERTANVKKPVITYIVGTASQPLPILLKNNDVDEKYDAVIANFSIHYFTTTKEQIEMLISNVLAVLKPGGYFVFTTFNGDRIYTELEKNNPLILKGKNDQVVFSLRKKYPESDKKLKHYGQMIEVFVESIGTPHDEGLMNLKYIIDRFCENDKFKLVENVSFSDLIDNYQEKSALSPAERKFSGFNNLIALQLIS